jgi:endonuclease/exonuclease/phosphatase family metal-dependent hydrolase
MPAIGVGTFPMTSELVRPREVPGVMRIAPIAALPALPWLAVSLLVGGAARSAVPGAPTPESGCEQAHRGETADTPTIRWVSPEAEGDRAALAAWCSPVGGPVVLGGEGEGGATVDSIAIVSWNVHVGGGDVSRLVEELRAGTLSGGRPVRDFVLLLQEVHRASIDLPPASMGRVPGRVEEYSPTGERLDVVALARRQRLALFYVPSMRNGRIDGERAEDRGNAILSTLPLSELEAIELPREAQRRVGLAVTVRGRASDGTPWQLRLANAHLDTRSSGTRLWASFGAGRLRQARAVADALPTDLPVVLGGDLNTWSLPFLEDALPALRTRFPQTPAPLGAPTFSSGRLFSRTLDHFFFRLPESWTARYVRLDDRRGSDHYPLLAWVRPATPPPLRPY